jgi:hypothetical protein
MNPIVPKMATCAFALGLVVSALAWAPPVSAAAFPFEISGGPNHQVSDEITITPSLTGLPANTSCTYELAIRQDTYPGQFGWANITQDAIVARGMCPAWTFVLPNTADMVAQVGDAEVVVRRLSSPVRHEVVEITEVAPPLASAG